ncbi:hypothetical protein [Lentzea albida]|uniref:Uncharacterized protein n=1 Tax=Lentzea albida TaxID=65499 RepID=A0A1H9CST3_9PSEU|nr:hypothetical protein [Lentzea albida]SEQ04280.1 hypothetical protein SAMN04488000_1011056 [Lentzea albida]
MKLLHIVLAAAAAALVVGVAGFLLLGGPDEPAASQPTSTSLPSSSPGSGWTEEEMRNARPKDMTAGPSVAVLVSGLLAGAATAGVLLLVRRRSSSR